MTKHEFILQLNDKLSGIPKDELEERLSFYSEMIDDRIEEGLSEENAVADIGTVDEIVSQVIAEIPLVKIVKNKINSKRKLRAWEITFLALGSPIWVSLLVALFAVVLSVYVVLWSVIASLWAVFASFVACAVAGVASGVMFIVLSNVFSGIAIIAAAIVLSGLSIFMFFGCKYATKGTVLLTKKIAVFIKKCFVKKEEK
jgi:uncharacterized membrane protein